MISITKIFTFETAHRISSYQGACQHIHGHSYKLHVTVTGKEIGEDDMLMDFKVLKQIVKEYIVDPIDHAIMLKRNEVNRNDFGAMDEKIFWMSSEPTAERMLEWMANQLQEVLPAKIELKRLRLFETENSFAEWKK